MYGQDGHAAQGDGGDYIITDFVARKLSSISYLFFYATRIQRSVVSDISDFSNIRLSNAPNPTTGSAIETAMKVKVRLTVRKDKPYVTMPQYNTPPTSSATATQHPASEEYYCTTGIDSGELSVPPAFTTH